MTREHGFTLIEVLLATALLAAGIALAFATLKSAGGVVERGEQLARRNERMRAVERVLRARLTAVRPINGVRQGQAPSMFSGQPDEMSFVADVPAYLGGGGAYLHQLSILGPPGARRLQLGLRMVHDGQAHGAPEPLPPEVLVDGVADVQFRYRGLDEAGALGPWQPTWETPGVLPLLVEIRLLDEPRGPWPPVVVALHMASGHSPARSRQ